MRENWLCLSVYTCRLLIDPSAVRCTLNLYFPWSFRLMSRDLIEGNNVLGWYNDHLVCGKLDSVQQCLGTQLTRGVS